MDTERIEAAVRELLLAIGEDPERAGLIDTPTRVGQAYADLFSGIGVDPVPLLGSLVDAEPGAAGGEPIVFADIPFVSTCEHHLLPFTGTVGVAYVPRDRVVGLGRIPRVIGTLASRPQLQERLTEEIADALVAGLSPNGALVLVRASHSCVWARGTRTAGTTVTTIAARGSLTEPGARAEVMGLLGAFAAGVPAEEGLDPR